MPALRLLFRSGVDQCVHTLEIQPGAHRAGGAARHSADARAAGFVVRHGDRHCGGALRGGRSILHVAVRQGRHARVARRPHLGPSAGYRRPSGRRGAHRRRGRPGAVRRAGVGFLVYKLLGFFGFGAVFYTLVLRVRARRAGNGSPPVAAANPAGASNPPAGGSATMAGPGWTAGAAPPAGAAAAAAAAGQGLADGRRPVHRRMRLRSAPPVGPPAGAPQSPRPCRAQGFGCAWGRLFLELYWWVLR